MHTFASSVIKMHACLDASQICLLVLMQPTFLYLLWCRLYFYINNKDLISSYTLLLTQGEDILGIHFITTLIKRHLLIEL